MVVAGSIIEMRVSSLSFLLRAESTERFESTETERFESTAESTSSVAEESMNRVWSAVMAGELWGSMTEDSRWQYG